MGQGHQKCRHKCEVNKKDFALLKEDFAPVLTAWTLLSPYAIKAQQTGHKQLCCE